MNTLRIERVPVGAIRTLRHRVLRPGLPIETASWPRDENPDTQHFAVFVANQAGNSIGEAICCATFVRVDFGAENAWQLRAWQRRRSIGDMVQESNFWKSPKHFFLNPTVQDFSGAMLVSQPWVFTNVLAGNVSQRCSTWQSTVFIAR